MPRLSNSPNLAAIEDTIARVLQELNDWVVAHPYFAISQGLVATCLFFLFLQDRFPTPPPPANSSSTSKLKPAPNVAQTVSAMQAEAVKLDPPKDTPFTADELKEYDGEHGKGIYVAIKGTIFDVSAKVDMYGPGKGYHVFTGKDASVALGKSSLKPEDAHSDYSTLDESEMKVLEDWYKYFEKRYNIVGKVVESK